MPLDPSRRSFLRQFRSVAGGLSAATVAPLSWADSATDNGSSSSHGWLRRSLKAGMIRVPGAARYEGWEQKFRVAIEAGFEGVEPKTGDHLPVADLLVAADKTGMIIEGTHGGYHWETRHTDPDPAIRQRAQRLLEASLAQTAALGADTFLIVPGHGGDGTPEEVRRRAFDAITAALPLAERLGVSILIENVWNEFLYAPDGGSDQSVQPLADFVDSFGSEWVGLQFDLGNHWKFGDIGQWVTDLGSRIKKLDIKGFSRQDNKFTDITEGDIDWESIRKALAGIGFEGWLAAEVGGGDADRLQRIAGQMNQALSCDQPLASQ